MNLRLVSVDELQFLTCYKNSVWGSKTARFTSKNKWNVDDYLVILVDKTVAGLAKVSGEPFFSKKEVWDNGTFPYRIPIKFEYVALPKNRLPVLGEIRDALTSEWGPSYGWGILNQRLLGGQTASVIVNKILASPNNIQGIHSNLEQLIKDAQLLRDSNKTKITTRPRKQTEVIETVEKESLSDQATDSLHKKIQKILIKLGKISGCSVWAARNDKKNTKNEGCLEEFPSLGLSDEAISRISLIDVLWIQQGAPICAYEIESITPMYEGLLRMSDLLTVVPALKIKLYVVALRKRQEEFMKKITQPTFRKIGLSDYCEFVSVEDLTDLFTKVDGLQGLSSNVIDNIGIEVED
mgnify:CR=1 FL=1